MSVGFPVAARFNKAVFHCAAASQELALPKQHGLGFSTYLLGSSFRAHSRNEKQLTQVQHRTATHHDAQRAIVLQLSGAILALVLHVWCRVVRFDGREMAWVMLSRSLVQGCRGRQKHGCIVSQWPFVAVATNACGGRSYFVWREETGRDGRQLS